MKALNHRPLGLEALEDRWVPATVRFDGSNLYVSNLLIRPGGTSSVTITEAFNGPITVNDGTANDGTYTVTGNVYVMGNNAKDTIIVNIGAPPDLVGNLFITAGNGNDTVTVDGQNGQGPIAGNVNVSLGTGTDTVLLGATNGLSVRGTINVAARGTGANSATFGTGTARSPFLGAVYVSDFPTLTLGASKDIFAGGISVQNTINPQASKVVLGGSDLGNFQLSSGQGATSIALNNNVLGNVSLNLANGANSVTLAGGAAAITLGNLYVNAGNGANSLTLGGTNAVNDLGSAYFNLGNGANSIGSTASFTVNNNVFVNDGNGGLTTTAAYQGPVGGNLTVNVGNGNNSFSLGGTTAATAPSVGGTFSYLGGNGGNSVTVTDAAANLLALNPRFGNSPGTGAGGIGNNVFTIGAGTTAGVLTGFVSWGIPSSAANGNAFTDNGYIWTNMVTLVNIPS